MWFFKCTIFVYNVGVTGMIIVNEL
jgi:hypothetical protein